MHATIDAHHHLWDTEVSRYPYLEDGSRDRMHGKPLPRRYTIQDFRRDIGGTGIVASVHIQCGWDPSNPVGETAWIESIAQEFGLPSAIVAHSDLASPDVERELEAHVAASSRMRGIRQHVGWHENPRYRLGPRAGMLEEPAWLAGYAILARHGLSFDLQAFYPQFRTAAALAARHPDTPMILGNAGMPIDNGAEEMVEWRSAVRDFARVPNTFVKIGGFGMIDRSWTADSVRPLVDFLIDAFGPQRCMLGSNFPVDGLHKTYQEVWSAFETVLAGYGPADKESIFSGTARRVYRIG